MWCIPPQQNAAFVWRMEALLDLYHRPYDPHQPVLCMDESYKELQIEQRFPLPARPGLPARFDYTYKPAGAATLLLCVEPLRGWRYLEVSHQRTQRDWALFMRHVLDHFYPDVICLHLVVDNLNIHAPAAFYKSFPPDEAKRLLDRLVFHFTPVHGSWLNMAEIEFSVLARQCLAQRFPTRDALRLAVDAWSATRNQSASKILWQLTLPDARLKLHHLYPSFHD
jgi:hypothetical protein